MHLKALRLPRAQIRLALFAVGIPFLVSGPGPLDSASSQPPIRVPSEIAWTDDTIAAASNGDAVRGLVLARRCARCHGDEGFSSDSLLPNLAGMDKLAFWKEMNDFRDRKENRRLWAQSPMLWQFKIIRTWQPTIRSCRLIPIRKTHVLFRSRCHRQLTSRSQEGWLAAAMVSEAYRHARPAMGQLPTRPELHLFSHKTQTTSSCNCRTLPVDTGRMTSTCRCAPSPRS